MLSFYGLARIGEILRCRRSDLLLPADLDDEHGCSLLDIQVFAEGLRRHLLEASQESSTLRFRTYMPSLGLQISLVTLRLKSCFGLLCQLAAYRHRRDVLLRHLDVFQGLRLTPRLTRWWCRPSVPVWGPIGRSSVVYVLEIPWNA